MKTVGVIIIALFMICTTSVVVQGSPLVVCGLPKSCSEKKALSPQAPNGSYVITLMEKDAANPLMSFVT